MTKLHEEKNILDTLLDTAEVFHYANKFKESTFVIGLEKSRYLDELWEDLKILVLAQIKLVVFVKEETGVKSRIRELEKLGIPMAVSFFSEPSDKIVRKKDKISLVIIKNKSTLRHLGFWDIGFKLAKKVKAQKYFITTAFSGLEIGDVFKPNPSLNDLNSYLNNNHEINIGSEFLKFLYTNLNKFKLDLILLKGETGNLYKEIFTHYGSGTLISNKETRILRRAVTSDVLDLFMLMKPYIDRGLLLPISIEKLTKDINSFYVLASDNAIIATAKLNDYGEAYEFAKFSTLPRYQGKGRAKSLALQLLQVAKKQKKEYCFALTVEPKVGEFFKQLGFKLVDRRTLPEKWKEKYDFRRPSKAYRFDLNKKYMPTK